MKTKLLINEVKLVGYTMFYCLMGHLIRAPPPPHTRPIKRYGYPIEGGGVKGDYRGLRETIRINPFEGKMKACLS